jgi:PAS domain S-box-containing protein
MIKKRIMLVEDESVTAMDLKSNLIQLGYEVPIIATRGEDAIRYAADLMPDLILMDITLAGAMNGIQAAEQIRIAHAIPIVFLSAHADTETIGRAKTTEPFGYLPKPSTMDTLMSTIEVALYKGEADALRRKAEDQLRKVMNEQRIILDNTGVGILFAKNRKILWANKGVVRMIGYSQEEVEGQDTLLFYPDRQSYERIGTEGYTRIARGEVYTSETPMKKKDGSLIWCHLVGQTVNPNNPDEGAIWILEDVTRRKELEDALQKSEAKYRTVAEFTYDWEFWIGQDERMLYISPSCERITGHPASAFEQDPALMTRIIHPDDATRFTEHRHEAREGKASEELEFRIIRTDGTIRWIAHVCQPVHDDQGNFNGTRGNNRDITQRKKVEQEREDALAKVKTLSGMLPICASCKKIRDDKGYWQQIEAYISDHSKAEFSHGICPDCAQKIYGKYYKPQDTNENK